MTLMIAICDAQLFTISDFITMATTTKSHWKQSLAQENNSVGKDIMVRRVNKYEMDKSPNVIH